MYGQQKAITHITQPAKNEGRTWRVRMPCVYTKYAIQHLKCTLHRIQRTNVVNELRCQMVAHDLIHFSGIFIVFDGLAVANTTKASVEWDSTRKKNIYH